MQIKSVRSLRFGPLPDGFSIALPDSGLIPVIGPNEAGKSSLLALLRALLYKDRRISVSDGEGGRLDVAMDDGSELHIERLGGKHRVWDDEGRALSDDEWMRRLQADYPVFQNVYAFGLGELERGETLDPKTVGARLISAGLGVHVDLVKVENTLVQRARELYTPRGSKPPLNAALSNLRRLEEQIQQGEAELRRYDELQNALQNAEAEALQAGDEERQQASERKRLSDMERVWDRFERLQDVNRERSALEHARGIGPELVARFERLREEVKGAALRVEAQRKRTLEARHALPTPARRHAFRRAEWISVMEEARQLQDWEREIARHRGSEDELWARMTTEAERLGLAPERLAAGLPVRVIGPRAGELFQELQDSQRRVADAERDLTLAARAVEAAGLEAERLSEVPRRGEWASRRARLEALAQHPLPVAEAPLLLWAATALLALAAAALDRVLPGIAAAGGAVVLSLIGLSLALRRRRRLTDEALMEAGLESPLRLAAERLDWEQVGERVTEREQADERLQNARRDLDEARVRMDRAREDEVAARGRYEALLTEEDLPDLPAPELQHWLSQVDDALHTISLYRREQEARRMLEERLGTFLDQAEMTARVLHVDVQDARDPATWLQFRREWLEIPKREERLRELEDEAEQARKEAERVEQALYACLRELDAPTVDVAALRVAEGLQYEELSREAMRLEAELSAASQGLGVEGYRPYQDVGLDDAVEAARVRFLEARAIHQGRQQEAADLRRRLAELESSGELQDLRLEAEARRGEAARLHHRWATYTLAAEVLRESREHFQRERQPDVLRRASALFSDFTGGRYRRVLAAADNVRELSAELPDGSRYHVDALSRGTQEQLYLALRLAWIESREQHAERMPLVLDDILVNADPVREQVMARALVRFAKNRQVLYLTCHPEVEKSLRKAKSRAALELSQVLAAR